jgi:hypothetical protein
MVGKGWHLESQRHSTARRYGSAGGKMPKKFKPVAYSPPYKPMKFKEDKDKPFIVHDDNIDGLSPQGNVWIVMYANETKSKEFKTKKEAQEFKKSLTKSKLTSEYVEKYLDKRGLMPHYLGTKDPSKWDAYDKANWKSIKRSHP